MKEPRRGSFDGLPPGNMTRQQAAQVLGVSPETVYAYCKKGLLVGRALSPRHRFLVTRASVEAALARIEGRSE